AARPAPKGSPARRPDRRRRPLPPSRRWRWRAPRAPRRPPPPAPAGLLPAPARSASRACSANAARAPSVRRSWDRPAGRRRRGGGRPAAGISSRSVSLAPPARLGKEVEADDRPDRREAVAPADLLAFGIGAAVIG